MGAGFVICSFRFSVFPYIFLDLFSGSKFNSLSDKALSYPLPSPLILKAIPPPPVPSYLHTSIQSRRRSHFRIPAKGAGFANSTNFRFPLSFFGIICDIPEGVFIDACFYLVNRIPVHQFPFIAWLSTQNTQRGSDGGRRG